MTISDYVKVEVVLSPSAKADADAFDDELGEAWRAGFVGDPVPDDASEAWREAHALGASC